MLILRHVRINVIGAKCVQYQTNSPTPVTDSGHYETNGRKLQVFDSPLCANYPNTKEAMDAALLLFH